MVLGFFCGYTPYINIFICMEICKKITGVEKEIKGTDQGGRAKVLVGRDTWENCYHHNQSKDEGTQTELFLTKTIKYLSNQLTCKTSVLIT